jgi:hypothetical protein
LFIFLWILVIISFLIADIVYNFHYSLIFFALFGVSLSYINKRQYHTKTTPKPSDLFIKTLKVFNNEISEIQHFLVNCRLKTKWRNEQYNHYDQVDIKQELATIDNKQLILLESFNDLLTNIFFLESNSHRSKTALTCYSIIKPDHPAAYLKCTMFMLNDLEIFVKTNLYDFETYLIEEDTSIISESKKDIIIKAKTEDIYAYLKNNENKLKVNKYLTNIIKDEKGYMYDYQFKVNKERLVFRNKIKEIYHEVTCSNFRAMVRLVLLLLLMRIVI